MSFLHKIQKQKVCTKTFSDCGKGTHSDCGNSVKLYCAVRVQVLGCVYNCIVK